MNRFNGSAPVAKAYSMDNLELHTWFERDRSCVELRCKETDATVFEVWDEACQEAFEDGFLDRRNLKESAYEWAKDIGAIA